MSKIPAPNPPYLGPAAHTSAGSNQPIKRIVIHSTVSECKAGGARSIAAYFRSPSSGGSAHYVVDPGEAVQVVYDNTIAWHAPPNGNSIGVELCDQPGRSEREKAPVSRWDDKPHTDMLNRAAALVAQLCLAYDVPIVRLSVADLKAGKKGICGHVDVSQAFKQSSHWDPGNFPWDRFMVLVRAEADKLSGKTPARQPATKPTTPAAKPNRVQSARAKLTEALADLDAAVANGRVGTVKTVRDNLRAELKRLPKS